MADQRTVVVGAVGLMAIVAVVAGPLVPFVSLPASDLAGELSPDSDAGGVDTPKRLGYAVPDPPDAVSITATDDGYRVTEPVRVELETGTASATVTVRLRANDTVLATNATVGNETTAILDLQPSGDQRIQSDTAQLLVTIQAGGQTYVALNRTVEVT
jgi:hypothetical protein